MKYIDLYESKFLTDKEEIIEWLHNSLRKFDVKKLIIKSDGLIYKDTVYFEDTVDTLRVQFKEVTGNFLCNDTNVTSLEGCPQVAVKFFACDRSPITSLKFCPRLIGSHFYCRGIKIADPKEYRYALYSEIGGEFMTSNKEIEGIINTYAGSANRKYWPKAINLLSKVKL